MDRGAPCDGPHPCIVFSLDGRKEESYDKFSAAAVSAALLERFYHTGEGQEQPLDILMDAVDLYNDWQCKEKADALEIQLDATEPDSEEDARLKEQYEAYVANIRNEDMKSR